MKYQLGLEYDEIGLFMDMQIELEKAMEQVMKSMVDFMKAYCGDPDIINSFRYEEDYEGTWDKWDSIRYVVGSDHWKAFIANYGKGSLMASESQNPFLAEYKSKYFHEHRSHKTNAISARAKTAYGRVMPDFESGDGYVTVNGTGRIPAGTNLEGGYAWKTYNVRVRPKKPTFFMERSFDFFDTEMQRRLQEVLDNFPYDKYLKGVGR